ncbi:phosphatidic acid phosphatase type 2/haloperoxidase [Ampelomyces quisqualis]|uniref:Phosphatidic acid phosphatase type 2/haloperoxidase n=1 Tax=Ampelomyces quisqualis TaxID=50730 RepID=A0A6A5QH08_AMPQU|nr:phosphatidic acid phosphatase type 2/haloperoxidase [Ampelomyces quisqualis]
MPPASDPPRTSSPPFIPPPSPPPTIKPSSNDIESTTSLPPRRRALLPGFTNPPSIRTFLRHNAHDISTQLLCLLTAYILYQFCPPIMPRHFPFYPGIEKTAWGMKHSKPHMAEYITTNVSAVTSFAVPAAIMGVYAVWWERKFQGANAALIGLGYALSTATLFQSFIKIFVGGLRPHFLTLCLPAIPPSTPGLPGAAGVEYFTPKQVCTASGKPVKEAQMSFPSGHACAAFAGFGFLALWLNAKFKVLSRDVRGRDPVEYHEENAEEMQKTNQTQRVHHWKLVLFVAPWCIAVVLALSKLRDAWHHPVDIVFGALVGTAFAHMAYKMVYRSVYDSRMNHVPLGGVSGERVDVERKEV